MRIIKILLIVGLLAGTAVGGFYFAAMHLRPEQLLENKRIAFLHPIIKPMIGENKGISLPKVQLGQVLGARDEKPKIPASQQAFEKGRYVFCQQVMKDYENRYGEENSSSPSPSEKTN